MSTDKRWSVKLSDVKTVILKCTKCGATMGYNPAKWKAVPHGCSNCSEIRFGEDSVERIALESLKGALAQVLGADGKFEVRLEFDGVD